MSLRPIAEGAGREIASQLTSEILSRPETHAVIVGTATVAIAAVPVVAMLAGGAALGVAGAKVIDYLTS